MKIIITGADGSLGTQMQDLLRREKISFLPVDIRQFDITDFRKTCEAVSNYRPDAILHFAAVSDVDACETDPERAYRTNALSTLGLVTAARRVAAKLLYTSTNFVFDGRSESGYYESDPAVPLSVYGRTKLAGETFVRDLSDRYYIVRTAWLFGKDCKTFIPKFLQTKEKPASIDVICDQIGSFTYLPDLCEAIFTLIRTENFGTYHLTNSGSGSWLDFSLKAKDLAKFKTELRAVKTEELNLPAPRPQFGTLLSRNYEFFFERSLRPWEAALADFVRDLRGAGLT